LGRGRVATLDWWQTHAVAHSRQTVFSKWRQCATPSNTRFLGPTTLLIPNCSSIGSVVFAALMLHLRHLSPPQKNAHFNPPLVADLQSKILTPLSNAWFLEPPDTTPIRHPKRIWIESAFLRNTRSLPTDRQTHTHTHQTRNSACKNRPLTFLQRVTFLGWPPYCLLPDPDRMAVSLPYTVSQKNDTDVAYYNFNKHQPISVIFGTDVAETVC